VTAVRLCSSLALSLLLIATASAPPTAQAHDLGPAMMAVSGAFVAPASSSPPVPDALAKGREIARRVRHFHAFRAEAAHGSWRKDEAARWKIRSEERCLATLEKLGVPFVPLARALTTPVATPVVLTGAVGGVSFRPAQRDRPIELSCELAARLPSLARLLRAHGVRAVQVNSSYRDQPRVSFHTFGLALDISAFETAAGSLVVARDYELAPDQPTCAATPRSEAARSLQTLACALAASGLFSTVITPNYNVGHRDHFHLDIRPNDTDLFVR